MLRTEITYIGHRVLLVCDRKCEKAWGMNGRRYHDAGYKQLSDDVDDIVYLPDEQTPDAPLDPGTYEGFAAEAKPFHPERHNRWCARECERSRMIEPGEEITYPDFSKPQYNFSSRCEDGVRPYVHTGETFTPENET